MTTTQQEILTYKGRDYPYTIEYLDDFLGDGSEWFRITCEEVGLKSEFLKEDMEDAMEFLKLFINTQLKEDCTTFEYFVIKGKKYKINLHRLGKKADGKIWARIVCKGAKYNKEHPEEQVEHVINNTIPALITAKQSQEKTVPYQIRFTP